jgi:hypothetical protein
MSNKPRSQIASDLEVIDPICFGSEVGEALPGAADTWRRRTVAVYGAGAGCSSSPGAVARSIRLLEPFGLPATVTELSRSAVPACGASDTLPPAL